MNSTIDDRLSSIEHFLERIESKMDNFLGFENLDELEKIELSEIKKEMANGKSHSYSDVFN